jgi:proteic killer suppression protein
LRVHHKGVLWHVVNAVVLFRRAEKDLATVPAHVAVKLEDVEDRGLEAVRKVPGYHDEPLKGELKGLRSIRLSKSYRAYYLLVKGAVEFVRVERVDKHVY